MRGYSAREYRQILLKNEKTKNKGKKMCTALICDISWLLSPRSVIQVSASIRHIRIGGLTIGKTIICKKFPTIRLFRLLTKEQLKFKQKFVGEIEYISEKRSNVLPSKVMADVCSQKSL